MRGKSLNSTQGQTQRERVLQFLREYIQEKGYPPSIREIKEALGYNTTSAPYLHLLRLHDEGKIVYTHGVARGIRIIQ